MPCAKSECRKNDGWNVSYEGKSRRLPFLIPCPGWVNNGSQPRPRKRLLSGEERKSILGD
jgi:hypothetical protein